MRKLMSLSMAILLIGAVALPATAQNQQNRRENPPGGNLADLVSLEGMVEQVSLMDFGVQPSFTLNIGSGMATIIASPRRILLDSDFSINIGDRMSVQAFPSPIFEGAYVAVELRNLSTGAGLTLRDLSGTPLRKRGAGIGGQGAGCCARNLTLTAADILSLEGVVVEVSAGIGQGHPTFLLAQTDGSQAAIFTGPYYLLMENNFAINPGDRMVVRAFRSPRFQDAYVALELQNLTTGSALTLRGEDGAPHWPPD